MPPSVDPIELIWTVALAGVLILCLWNYKYALDRLNAMLRAGENGVLLISRRGNCGDQLKLAGMAACSLMIGVVAMVTPPSTRTGGPPSITAIEFTVAMIGQAVLLGWLSVAVRLRPNHIARALEQESAHEKKKRFAEEGLHQP